MHTVNNSLMQSPCGEAGSRSDIQEIVSFIWKEKAHFHIQ
jgi:hypothetical protein